jgi:hypothetical protein
VSVVGVGLFQAVRERVIMVFGNRGIGAVLVHVVEKAR